jgi:hypothetical protein
MGARTRITKMQWLFKNSKVQAFNVLVFGLYSFLILEPLNLLNLEGTCASELLSR